LSFEIPDQGFAKEFRLLSKSDFNSLKHGTKLASSGVLLSFYKTNSLSHSRIGLAVSKKLGNAVKRNKIKRKLRELFRKSDLKSKNFDLLLTLNFRYIKKNQLTFDDIYRELELSYKELNLS
tara:strand:+ start:19083 stop:19448 length:366 start_codon:yes stop_codon:yes gene_type:complete